MSVALRHSIDKARLIASDELDQDKRAVRGQFMTPSAIADFMASLFQRWPSQVRLLDPGAGIGSLTEAFVGACLKQGQTSSEIEITAYEIEPLLLGFLENHLNGIVEHGIRAGRTMRTAIFDRDFIAEAVFALSFGGPRFSHVILNPPYKKIGAASAHRHFLRKAGIETVNLYAGFLALSIALCEPGGEIVAIVPRSFCNGAYFRPFRQWLLERVAITHIHLFESRNLAFQDDDVLQENVIVRLCRSERQGTVLISTSRDATFHDYSERQLPFTGVVKPDDDEYFIRVPIMEANGSAGHFCKTLSELGLDVATGPVVDFRVREHWLFNPTDNSAPLLYAHHFRKGQFQWPCEHRKPNALACNEETRKWLMPRGWYALTKRFSSKEERRRIVAYVVDPAHVPGELYGFENHLNVIHCGKRGLSEDLAHGIALFLNSTIVDTHFRTFSGHTQVNATDLRSMSFPNRETLIRFGRRAKTKGALNQEAIDRFVESDHGE